ncbi:MAG: PD40 domain-containing protein [Saprospiraceae bacterium]|nr:PD40 domain-containing protein [Saprospiraceae bacterium]
MRILPFKNLLRKIALTCLALAAMSATASLLAQNKTIEKANEMFKYNQFSDAGELYRQALQEMENEGKLGRNATVLRSKLAYCYRMNNKMDMAETLYAEVVKDETAKDENLYYYGEALMSNGKYEEARKWFTDYQKLNPDDEKAGLMLRACDYAPLIQPYFQYIDIQEFPFNSEADDNAPVASRKGLIFSSDRKQGLRLMKEKSGWTGRDYLNLYISEKKSDGSFAEPIQYSSKLSEVNKNTGNASITADGTEIFFTRNDNVLNKQNTYSLQLFSAKSGETERWKDVEKLPFCSSNHNFMHPAISPDGKTLFFASNRAGGFGGTDLWVSERSNGEWGKPENLGPAVNTTANEGFPFVALDGKLYFCSKGHPGFGGFDIFVTYKDENGAWQSATNLGKPINSPLDDISIYLSNDQRSGYFTSSRSGGDDDIYMLKVLDKAPELPAVQEPIVETKPVAVPPVLKEEPAPIADERQALVQPTPPAPAKQEMPSAAPPKEEVAVTLTVGKPEEEPKVVTAAPVKPLEKAPVAPETTPITIQKPKEPAPVLPPATTKAVPVEEVVVKKPVQDPFAPVEPIKPTTSNGNPEQTYLTELGAFGDFSRKLSNNSLSVGERFRLDKATFDVGVWQLTPRIISPLNQLVALLKTYPSLQVEISTHTEALGVDEYNLRISESRASSILDYLLTEGIAQQRILTKGCGETMPLNHCRNGDTCSMDEHMVNHRIEVKVLALDGKW